MKKITFYLSLLFCGLFLAAGLSSCLSEGEDYSIEASKQNSYQTYIQIAGSKSYTARLYYSKSVYGNTYGVKYDSLPGARTNFVPRDSTFTVASFPVCKLDSAINVDSTVTSGKYREIFEAIKASTDEATIRGTYYVPNKQCVQDSYIQFLMGALMTTTLHYENADHNVAFCFSPTTYYSFGYYYPKSSSCEFQLYLSAIYLDFDNKTGKGTTLGESWFRPINIVFK